MTSQKTETTGAQSNRKATPGSTSVEHITIENANVPGYKTQVDATRYQAMRQALLKILPDGEPGLTQTEMREVVRAHLPKTFF
jgi:hypothetical protein